MKCTIWISLAACSYLLGAVPFGFLIARMRGVDIRKVGSGNIGATNVFRSVGKSWGILTFACDALKGFVPAFFFPLAAQSLFGLPASTGAGLLFGAFAIVGHNWPVYIGFRGGKGVATSAGALIGIAWLAMLIALAVWVLVFLAGRYVSLASIAAALALAGAAWPLYLRSEGWFLPAALSALALLAIARHKSNIRRLLSGTEHRFGSARKSPTAPEAEAKP